MQKPKISVIIPVFNVECYLARCLDSIIQQTLTDIELICIDDASTDNSHALLQEYVAITPYMKIVHNQHSQGAGECRNVGLRLSKGKYVVFLDSDDWFDIHLLEIAYDKAEMCNAEVIFWDYIVYDEGNDKIIEPPQYPLDVIMPLSKCTVNGVPLTAINSMAVSPWVKMCRRDFIVQNDLQFQSLSNSNDVYFGYMTVLLAKKVAYIDKPLVYHRINRKGQISETRGKDPWSSYAALYKISSALAKRQLPFFNIFRGRIFGIIHYAYVSKGSSSEVRTKFSRFMADRGLKKLHMNNVNANDFEFPIDYLIWRDVNPYIVDNSQKNIILQNYFLELLKDSHLQMLARKGWRICLWGCGVRGNHVLTMAEENNLNIVCIIDKNPSVVGMHQCGLMVSNSLDNLCHFEAVIFTNRAYGRAIMNELINVGKHGVYLIDMDLFVCYDQSLEKCIYKVDG
ncbi:MAG: glycosyltransferase [Selenomonadaceae bacterium]|nr:glycosyltransferase [Selenomonadaceae bacterium]